MSTSSDISSLFKLFGGRSAHYQEISQEDEKQSSMERWPGVAKVELSGVAAEPAVLTPSGAAVRPALFAAVAPVSPAIAPESAPSPEAVPQAKAVAAPYAAPDWASESLHSLLGKLAQEDRREVVSAPVRVARPRPNLANIKIICKFNRDGIARDSNICWRTSAG